MRHHDQLDNLRELSSHLLGGRTGRRRHYYGNARNLERRLTRFEPKVLDARPANPVNVAVRHGLLLDVHREKHVQRVAADLLVDTDREDVPAGRDLVRELQLRDDRLRLAGHRFHRPDLIWYQAAAGER
jgi:hypothetical protein